MKPPVLPNFFIVGTGKAGTTSLYHYLRQHPQIYMSPIKEPCYFASEVHPANLAEPHLRHLRRMSRRFAEGGSWLIKEWGDYLGLFQNASTETAIGEASVVYMWSETAARNIASCVPDAKIVMILRDPAERAFSQYCHQLSYGLTRVTFREHLEECRKYNGSKIGTHHPFLEVGLYHDQVRRYFEVFPRQNIRIYWYEEVWKDSRQFLADLFDFIGVDASFRPDTSRKSLQRTTPRFPVFNYAAKQFEAVHDLREALPASMRTAVHRLFFRRGRDLKMNPEDRQYLVDYYREDIVKLASLLNRDLSAWLS